MKKSVRVVISAALIMAVLFLAAGCTGNRDQVDGESLMQDMLSASELPGMLGSHTGDGKSEMSFAAISDLDYDKVEEFWLYYAADGSAYELAVIKLKSEADMPELEKSLQKHIQTRVKQYEYYDPAEVSRAESAQVAVNGRYAALIMCDDVAAVRAVFDSAFRFGFQ